MRYGYLWGLYYVRIHPNNLLEQVKSYCVIHWGVSTFRHGIAFHGGWWDLLRLLAAIVVSHKSILLCFPHLSCKEPFALSKSYLFGQSHPGSHCICHLNPDDVFMASSTVLKEHRNRSAFLLCCLGSLKLKLKLRWAICVELLLFPQELWKEHPRNWQLCLELQWARYHPHPKELLVPSERH